MNDHLRKAKGALDAAREAEGRKDTAAYQQFLYVASLQTQMSIAHSLDRLAAKHGMPDEVIPEVRGGYL